MVCNYYMRTAILLCWFQNEHFHDKTMERQSVERQSDVYSGLIDNSNHLEISDIQSMI